MKWKFWNGTAHWPGRRAKIVALAFLAAMTGLVVGATSLVWHEQQKETARAQMLEHFQAFCRDCFALRNLPVGQGDGLRVLISQELRAEIQELRREEPVNDPRERQFIEDICASVLRDVRRNPDRYLCSAPIMRAQQRTAWNALQASGSTQFVVVPSASGNTAKNN